MKLHENNEEFRVVISNAAKNSSMPEHVVEKDYWVTKLLLNLSNYKHREYVVFKGGTSLSKGHKLINRFSEDIDLALHQDGIGEGKIHRRGGDALHQVIAGVKDSNFTDIANERESEKKRYKRAYNFPQIFTYLPNFLDRDPPNFQIAEPQHFLIREPPDFLNAEPR